jgi:hypothetical protein
VVGEPAFVLRGLVDSVIASELVADVYSEVIAETVALVHLGISARSWHVGGGEAGTLWPRTPRFATAPRRRHDRTQR